jgi:AraC family transcriptional regulator
MRVSDSKILRADTAKDVLGGIQPVRSSAESNCTGVLIESYHLPKYGPTPEYCYANRHVISTQRSGTATAHSRSRKVWHAGSVAICAIGAPQARLSFSDFSAINMLLDPAFVRMAVGDAINFDRLEIQPSRVERDEQLERLLLAADYEVALGVPDNRLLLESIGTAMAAHLVTHHATKRLPPGKHDSAMPKYLLNRAIDYIHETLDKNPSLADISAVVAMSPYHFCRSFKKSTGLTPHQYVMRERVRRAQLFLAEHRLSRVEIATALGFSDQSHFTRTFRSMVGVTPSQYSAAH